MSDIPAGAPSPSSSDIITPLAQEMQDSYLTYAMSVIMARALPDVRDGLKPSQRRILVAMHDLNLSPRNKHRKCALICGETMGKYHPHGEGVIYPTLVRMGQEWNMRALLIDKQGNFGSIDGDPPAAMRYTEARLAPLGESMLLDLEYETVDHEDNFDNTKKEPVVLPCKFPNLLVNGSEGIAVGMATRLVPHNLGEICDAIVAVIDNPEIDIDALMQIVPGPDFPTGAVIHGTGGIRDAYETGRGSITVRAVLTTEETRNGRLQIVVNEIPYGVLLPTIKERLGEAIEAGNIKGIDEVRDESGRDAMVRLVIVLKRDANIQVVTNQLWQYTPLQSNIHVMNVVLVNRVPRTLNLKQLIEQFIEHRVEVIRRRTAYLLRKARQRAHIVEGLILAVADIDEIIKIIRSSADVDEARQRLMAKALRLSEQATVRKLLPQVFLDRAGAGEQFLTRVQADAILSMQLRKLTGLEIEQLAGECRQLADEIAGYELILSDRRRVLDIISEDCRELKEKFADARRTRLEGAIGEIDTDALIQREDVIVTLSHEGYIKRVPMDTYRSQGRGGRGIRGTENKDGDFIAHLMTASTHDHLLFFTNRGRVYWLRVYDIPTMNRTARGRAIQNLLTFLSEEKQVAVLAVKQFEENFVFFTTTKGVVKKTPLSAFSRPRAAGIAAIELEEGDSLAGVALTTGKDEIVLGTREGMACRFDEDDVRSMGRSARGVRGIDLREDDIVIDMVVIQPGMSLLTVCENGFGKRTPLEEYRKTRRGSKGVINIRTTERNGKVVALRAISDGDEFMIITSSGILLRTGANELRDIGRATQGVKLIRVEDDDRVVAVAKVVREDGEEATERRSDESTPPPSDGATDAGAP
ncbi:MAG: DNA gyrase subunit A [Phycisphaerae bacterium]|nr:DNA gyrase subunit A [Phycisphaerae bacterium]